MSTYLKNSFIKHRIHALQPWLSLTAKVILTAVVDKRKL